MTFRSLARAAALAAVSMLLVTGIVKAVDCTVDLCGFSAGQATGLRDTFVDQVNTETIAGAKTFSSDMVLDDGTGASPSFTMTDATDETAVFSKVDSGYLTITTPAADGVNVLTGNLKIGTGTCDTCDGVDFYVTGQTQIDGALDVEGTLTYASLNDGTTALGATALELNAVADVSARLVTLTADTSITAALHSGRIILLAEVGGNAQLEATLPEATGTGLIFKFIIGVKNTADYEIQVATDDIFQGYIVHVDGDLSDTANAVFDWTASDSDTLDLDGDTLCGEIGDWVEVTDILTGIWAIKGVCRSDAEGYSTVFTAEQS